MKAKKQVSFKVDPKEKAVIVQAAKVDRRTMADFFVLSALEAAKRILAAQKIPPSSPQPEKSEAAS